MAGFPPIVDWMPAIPEAPSQPDSLDDRPTCQAQFRGVWPAMLYEQPADLEYRRLYHYLLALVDESIERVLSSLDNAGFADDTIVVFTSDHGDLLGAHGGLQQQWHNAYDEAIHVPLIIAGPGIDRPAATAGSSTGAPTSHIDIVSTLLGLAGADPASLIDEVGAHHIETHPLPGRDLSRALAGGAAIASEPIYFMTDDQISVGLTTESPVSHEPFEPVGVAVEHRVGDRRCRRSVVEAQPVLRRRRQRCRGLGAARSDIRPRGTHRSLG